MNTRSDSGNWDCYLKSKDSEELEARIAGLSREIGISMVFLVFHEEKRKPA